MAQVISDNNRDSYYWPALRFPSFSKFLGKLVINDLKAVIDRQTTNKRIFSVFDEFSVFAGDQVLNLVNMGREKGIHAIFGTQGLADLEKVDKTFKNQLLNCANSIICHRLNDIDSAEEISAWIGTKNAFTVTAKLDPHAATPDLGSVRVNKEFIVHPDAIKQELELELGLELELELGLELELELELGLELGLGEAFYITKIGEFSWEKILVKLS